MKIKQIKDLIKIAKENRKQGGNLVFCLVGHAGIGKTYAINEYVKGEKEKNPKYNLVTRIISQLEAPDFIGLPTTEGGRTRHNLPDFWPTEEDGIIFLDEINRGKDDIKSAVLQLLSWERRIGDYKLPEGYIVITAMNPDTDSYNVGNMDTAILDRIRCVNVDFYMPDFIEHMKEKKYHENVINFVQSGMWTYQTPEKISSTDGSKYIAPRTWYDISQMEKAGLIEDKILHREVVCDILGANIGEAYNKFCYEESPVLANDILKNKKEAFNRIKKYLKNNKIEGGMVSQTVSSVIDAYGENKINITLLLEIAEVLSDNADSAVSLIKGCIMCPNTPYEAENIIKAVGEYKNLQKIFKAGLNIK